MGKQTVRTLRAKHAAYQAGMNEGGDGFNPHTEALRQAQRVQDAQDAAALDAEVAIQRAAEDAEWTAEVTAARRAEWNAWVRTQGKYMQAPALEAQQQAQGWTMGQLKRQIARHGL